MQFFCKEKWIKAVPGILALVLAFVAAVMVSESEPVVVNTAAMACYEKVVALTFDDGPGYKTTMALLDGLRERDVKATFFLVGEKIEQRKCVIEQMAKDGHLIGNHTYSHMQLDSVNLDTVIAEIDRTNQLIRDVAGVEPKYLRPPYGIWTNSLESSIAMTPILWTVDSCDWNTKDVAQIVESVVSEVESGDIILMHDIYDTSVVAALEIIDQLKSKGFVFVTVDELMIE